MIANPADLALRHWQSIKGKARAPRRSDIDPAALSPILSQTIVIDLPATRMRVNGTTSQQIIGHVAELIELYADSDAAAVEVAIADMIKSARCLSLISPGLGIVLLPAIMHGPDPDRSVGVIDVETVPATPHKKIRLDHIEWIGTRSIDVSSARRAARFKVINGGRE
jgi:hypothetical protein